MYFDWKLFSIAVDLNICWIIYEISLKTHPDQSFISQDRTLSQAGGSMRLIYFTENGVNLIILAVFQIKIFRKIIFLQKRLTIRLCTARNKYPLLYFKICIQNQSFDLLMTWSAVDPNYMIITRTFIKVQKWTEIKTNLNIMYITESTTYK